MNIIYKNESPNAHYIEYELNDDWLTLDGELTIALGKYERDEAAHIDICFDRNKNLVMGVIPGVAELYAAQIDIPAREYNIVEDGTDEDGNTIETAVAIEFNPDNITLTLWGLED
jgi:hypothetical protein